MVANLNSVQKLPEWVPGAVRLYLCHIEEGRSLRALARAEGCHASTVLRQVRRFENRRDDPLVDDALTRLGRAGRAAAAASGAEEDHDAMSAALKAEHAVSETEMINHEARRILRRLGEPGALLAIAPDMEKAVVLKEDAAGKPLRIAVVERSVAEAFALHDWIACRKPGRVARYGITQAGRTALRRLLAAAETRRAAGDEGSRYADQHREWAERDLPGGENGAPRRLRYNLAESPVAALARRRDRDGRPFLPPELVAAAERLREDFELAQMGPRVAQNWDRFLSGGERGSFTGMRGPCEGPAAARDRVAAALRDLGPGLGDVALRACCYLEGLETAEKRLGWSARSGKIVLRIALQRLRRHYEQTGSPMIG